VFRLMPGNAQGRKLCKGRVFNTERGSAGGGSLLLLLSKNISDAFDQEMRPNGYQLTRYEE